MPRAKGRGSRRSIVAVQHVRAIMIAVAMPVVVMPGVVPIRVVAIVMVMIAAAVNAFFPIDATRREVARAGIGRALLDIVILRRGNRVVILHFRIRQALIAGVGWIVAAAARADIAARRAAGVAG